MVPNKSLAATTRLVLKRTITHCKYFSLNHYNHKKTMPHTIRLKVRWPGRCRR